MSALPKMLAPLLLLVNLTVFRATIRSTPSRKMNRLCSRVLQVVEGDKEAAGPTAMRCAATKQLSHKTDYCRSTWLRLPSLVTHQRLMSEPKSVAMSKRTTNIRKEIAQETVIRRILLNFMRSKEGQLQRK